MSPTITRKRVRGLQVLVAIGRHDQHVRRVLSLRARNRMRSSEDMSAQCRSSMTQHGRTGGLQRIEGRLEETVALAGPQQLPDLPVQVRSDVDQWAERPW